MKPLEDTVAPTYPPSIRKMTRIDLLAEPPPENQSYILSIEQERLIIENLPAVRAIAERICRLIPDQVSFAEIYCAGVRGLSGSLDHFEPGYEVEYRSLARSHICNAILEGIQSLVWAVGDLRRKGKPIELAIRHLTFKLSRSPTESEISQVLQMDVAAYHRLLDELRGMEIGVRHSELPNGFAEGNIVNLVNLRENSSQHRFQLADMRTRLQGAIGTLPERERLVLGLYYYDGLNLTEIGFVMNELESNVSRIHVSAILRLRSGLSDFGYS